MTSVERGESGYIGNPLPPGPERDHWIGAALDVLSSEEAGDHRASHYVFARKVLREPRADAAAIALRFSRTPLTADAARLLADDWGKP